MQKSFFPDCTGYSIPHESGLHTNAEIPDSILLSILLVPASNGIGT